MPKSFSILPHILELMRPLQGVSARPMFGGTGLFMRRKMFAILVNSELYFKTSDLSRSLFLDRGLKPFTYERKGMEVALSYYQAPAECWDEPRVMVEWAEGAIRAAEGTKTI